MNTDIKKLLNLSKREARLLEILYKNPVQNVSQLAKSVEIPRTTVKFLLGKLEKRLLVKKTASGKRFKWSLNTSNIEVLGLFEEKFVEVYKGLENFEKIYLEISELPNAERIFSFQGNYSVKRALSQISMEFFNTVHVKFKKRKLIIVGIVGEKTIEMFKKLDSQSLRSHLGRATIAYVVPDAYTSFDADIFSIKDKLYLFNFQKEIAVIITNPSITAAFHSLLAFMQDHSKKLYLNEYIQSILDERK